MQPFSEWDFYPAYIQDLIARQDAVKPLLDEYLRRLSACVVGNGYIDIVLDMDSAMTLLKLAHELRIAVVGHTYWCNCTPHNRLLYHCPHGGGGPIHGEDGSYFSECYQYDGFTLDERGFDNASFGTDFLSFVSNSNAYMTDYLAHRMKREVFFSQCLCPGIWLLVPHDWVFDVLPARWGASLLGRLSQQREDGQERQI
jgi:hypothetical protein